MFISVSAARADSYERQPSIDVEHYEIAIAFTDAGNVISGSTRIDISIRRDNVSDLWLDFEGMTVDRVHAGGEDCRHLQHDGRVFLQLNRPYSRNEKLSIEISYHGVPRDSGLLIGANRAGKRVIVAENWPNNAHRWFPCIDHPSDKATAGFLVTAPEKYSVVAPGSFKGRRSLPDGRALTEWREEVPIPSYCMVIAAAEYSVTFPATQTGIPLAFYAYPADVEEAAIKFARTNQILSYFSALLGDYPYEKLSQVETTTRIGGMENAGTIFYAEGEFSRESRSEAPVPHEIAHQWFGDSVTEADWDHLWLSEGFATYLDALFYEHADGEGAFRRRMRHAAETAVEYMRHHADPIIDPATTDVSKKLSPLNYQKGAWVLHMLRRRMGDDRFFEGLRRFYLQYAGRTVLTNDFQSVMEAVAGESLGSFFTQWLYQPGMPEYRIEWTWSAGGGELWMSIRQTQRTGVFDMPVDIEARCVDGSKSKTIQVSKEYQEFRIPISCEPSSLYVDPGEWLLKKVEIRKR